MTDAILTDRDKLVALLDSWAVAYEAEADSIVVDAGGYMGFFTFFKFTLEGKFVEMGVDCV